MAHDAVQQVNGFPGSPLWQWLFASNSTQLICKAHRHNVSVVLGGLLSLDSSSLPHGLPGNFTGTSSSILSRGQLLRALQITALH